MYKYVQSVRSFGDFGAKGTSLLQTMRQTRNFSPIVTLFVRDGTAAFFLCVFPSFLPVKTLSLTLADPSILGA